MVQQAATLDTLRVELDHLRRETRQELEQRDKRLRLAKAELCGVREEKDQAMAEVESLRAEYAAVKAGKQKATSSEFDVLSLDEHKRIMKRLEEEARRRLQSVEADNGHLAFQMTRLRIELAQLKNQVDDRRYPVDVLDSLTGKLKEAISESDDNGE